jgi:hypothetical protein
MNSIKQHKALEHYCLASSMSLEDKNVINGLLVSLETCLTSSLEFTPFQMVENHICQGGGKKLGQIVSNHNCPSIVCVVPEITLKA